MTESVAAVALPDEQEQEQKVQINQSAAINTNEQPEAKDVGGVAGQRLMSFIERIERLEEEKTALMEDLKEVYAEAKGVGFDVKAMRKLVGLRKMDTEKRHELEAILDLYKSAVGMM